MKNSLLLLLAFFQFLFLQAQNLKIEYVITLNKNNVLGNGKQFYTLLVKNQQSTYFNDPEKDLEGLKYKQNMFDKKIKPDGSISVSLSDNYTAVISKDNFYKDYEKDSLVYNDFFPPIKKVIVSEKISNLFAWKIIPKSDTNILNYKCKRASTEFRGRKYVAYFSQELGIMGGPWKFDGLPGVILYVYSEDKYFIIEPQSITKNAKIDDIFYPYSKDKVLSWEEFKKGFKDKMRKIGKVIQAKMQVDVNAKITDRIEDIQIEEMIFKK